jgi:hypothetical protein
MRRSQQEWKREGRIIKMDLRRTCCGGVHWIHLVQDRKQRQSFLCIIIIIITIIIIISFLIIN